MNPRFFSPINTRIVVLRVFLDGGETYSLIDPVLGVTYGADDHVSDYHSFEYVFHDHETGEPTAISEESRMSGQKTLVVYAPWDPSEDRDRLRSRIDNLVNQLLAEGATCV